METRDLDIFIDVVREGSFAAVARMRGVDPSSISRQIAALEGSLGYRVFDRTTRRLRLTEAGEITFERIQTPLEEIKQIRATAADALNDYRGNLKITASVAFGERWLVPRLKAFNLQYPEIEIDLMLTDAKVDLISKDVDVAIRLGNKLEGDFVVSRLMSTHYRVVASPQYVADHGLCGSPAELKQRNCIICSIAGYGSKWRFRKKNSKAYDVDVSGRFTISSALAIRRAALEGLGPALVVDWIIEDDIVNGYLVDLFSDHEVSASDFDTAAWIVYPTRDYVPTKTRVFIDYLKSSV